MPGDGLAQLQQTDFSAGSFTEEARDLVAANGLTDGINVFIGDDGLPVRRGGSSYKGNAGFGAGGRFLWDGYLAGGQRTVFADPSDFGILAVDDVTPFNLGGGGLATPGKAASLNGMLFLPDGSIYGGSRKTAGVSRAGEIIVAVKGSPTIQTSNPPTHAWNDGSIDAGMLLRITSGLGDNRYYAVKSIDSDHQVTLASPYLGEDFVDFVNFEFVPIGTHPKGAGVYFTVANRLIVCIGDTAYESDTGDPTHFTANELQRVPAGVSILGGEGVRDTGILFTTGGIWSIGNIALRLTDGQGNVQQRFEQINRDIVLWSAPGVATWGATLIVPAVDGVYLFDPVSAPQNIIGGLRSLYRRYVDAGYHTGLATVFNGFYLLPILDSSEQIVDTLVCRLQATRRGQGNVAFAWTRKDGDGSKMTALTVRVPTATARQPYLIGIHRDTGRIHRLNDFNAAAANASDADGTAHVAELVTPEYRITTSAIKTLCRRLRARYELTDPAASNPVLQLSYSLDGGAWVPVTDTAPEAAFGDHPFPWAINKRAKGVRFRIRTSGPVANFVLHSLEVFVRQSGKQ